jgi:polysaccharide pyruvyl transferase WcaK-like protein
VGSDQVWNYNNNGRDFAYLLDFVEDDTKKISYSSSFGIETIQEDLKEKYKYYFSKISKLSTREEYGVKLINELCGKEAELVLDPVFLLSKENWLDMSAKLPKTKKYIFFYTNKNKQLENFINNTKIPTNEYSIHKLTGHLSPLDFVKRNVKVRYSMSPNEFISEINNADIVVSASFHCIAMSLILNKLFVAIITGNKGKDERVLNILRHVGLENRIFNENMTLDDIYRPIDYNRVNVELRKYVDRSSNYLRNSINS